VSRYLRVAAATALTVLVACGEDGGPAAKADAVDTSSSVDADASSIPDTSVDGDTTSPDDAADVSDTASDTSVVDTALPDRVTLRTTTESFNQRYFVALREGRIWVKPNTDVTPEAPGDWHLLGGTGLPSGANLVNFPPPDQLIELSADGIHLQALSQDGVFYRGDDLTNPFLVEGTFNWTDRWGWPAAQGPGLEVEWLPGDWSVSDSHPLGVASYQDIDGTTHGVGMGVAHIYRLGPDRRRIHFNDWWLPADWSRQVCGPERGTFAAENLSVSASTLFVIDASGVMYTRLYDFDTGGENALLTYSYVIDGPSGTTRKLPAESWRRQPAPDGEITERITIFQDGQGNAARVLRVEGRQGDLTGYFEKRIYDEAWAFFPTGAPLSRPVLDGSGAPERVGPDDHPFAGTLARDGESLTVRVPDFNLFCSPARAQLVVDGVTVTAGGAPLELPLHHVHLMVTEVRATDYWRDGEPASIRAALLPPPELGVIDDAAARARVAALLGDERVINFTGTATLARVELSEIPWTEPFLVPGDEKAFGPAYALELDAAPVE